MRGSGWTYVSIVIAAAVVVAACGGGDDDSSGGDDGLAATSQPPDPSGNDDPVGDDEADPGAASTGGSVVLGEPTLTADPSVAWAEVGEERIEYEAAGSINVNCVITDEQVAVNFQTADGHDFLVQGSPQSGDWFLNMTFAPGADNVRYTAESMGGHGVFTIGDGALSYEGIVGRVVDFDVVNAEEVDARVAVNCASPGGDPTATVGDATYTFPLSGAQSVSCAVSETAIDVRVNRLAIDDLQLEVTATDQDGMWVGAAVVYTADGNFTSPLPSDGTGVTIDGTTLTYMGTFQSPAGNELDGSVTITC